MITCIPMIRAFAMMVLISSFSENASGAVGYFGGAYVQDFDSLSNSGTASFDDSSTLQGWYAVSADSGVEYSGGSYDCAVPVVETATADNYTASAGGGSSAKLYSFGSSGSSDRALGSISIGDTTDFYIGLCITNRTGDALNGFSLTYDAEQWRDSGSGAQKLLVYYHIGGDYFRGMESWTQLNDLTFTSLQNSSPAPVDGNNPANRATLVQTVNDTIPADEKIWFVWVDLDYQGVSDHGLAIDNVKFMGATGELHVDAASGSDGNDGYTPGTALKTIQEAADRVQAGDEVIIHQGVYNERVVLSTFGTSNAPIVFRADDIVKDQVILTSADPAIRNKDVTWQWVSNNLYYVSYTNEKPDRVLYNNVDLYAYTALSNLNTFTTSLSTNAGVVEGGVDGPRHGWCYDEANDRLYVRLHTNTALYGTSIDPNSTNIVMAVGPEYDSGDGFTITGTGPAYVQLNGITFETPGQSAIYTTASAITIQNCWFFGCPYGVRGNNTKMAATTHSYDPYYTASDIVIKRCEFTERSTYNDAVELLMLKQASGESVKWEDIWHRKKDGRRGLPEDIKGYECGIAAQIGRDWVIRSNYIHDIFEGLANDSMSSSVGATVIGNVFARICDNGIETENHATNVVITQNVFLDNFEPFSCQPLNGIPWPSDIAFCQNVIVTTPGPSADLWTNVPSRAGARAVFKIGLKDDNWDTAKNPHMDGYPTNNLSIPGGANFFNNTIYFPGGRLVNVQGDLNVPLAGVTFDNNLFSAEFLCSTTDSKDLKEGFFAFTNNLVVLPDACPDAPAIAAGSGGSVYTNVADLGWVDPENGNFSLTVGSPARDSGTNPGFANIGAIQSDTSSWFPPKVGPCSAVTDFADY